ncbi:hypothetical protein, partial [Microcoleus anatoxicus]|uniref:hypothetical protein n=1 Tax=Microcoleus anatoxicus TaxID=2705319 RepID=UPI0030C9C91D
MKNIKGLFFRGFLGGGFVLFLVDLRFFMFVIEGRRKKEEGRRKKEEGRRKKEEGRRKKEEGRRKKEEGRR